MDKIQHEAFQSNVTIKHTLMSKSWNALFIDQMMRSAKIKQLLNVAIAFHKNILVPYFQHNKAQSKALIFFQKRQCGLQSGAPYSLCGLILVVKSVQQFWEVHCQNDRLGISGNMLTFGDCRFVLVMSAYFVLYCKQGQVL